MVNGMSAAVSYAARSLAGPRSDAIASGLIVALGAAFLFAIAAFSPAVLGDGDTWSHIATGEWIFAHGAVPRSDPFSHSMPHAPWVAHEWFSEILLTLAYRFAGWSGVALLTACAAGSAALIMGLRVARELSGGALAVTLMLGLGLWTANLLARPHVLALPLLALWAVGLMQARDRRAPPPIWLALLMIPWANMHGGFVFGLALIGPFALEAAEAAPGDRLETITHWTLFGLAALAAALINPYGVEALLFPFRLMAIANLSHISEWEPTEFSHIGPFEIALLALIGFALIRPAPTPPVRAALVVLLIAMALGHVRHAQLLGLLGPMLLAGSVAAAVAAPCPSEAERKQARRVASVAALAAALAISAVRVAAPVGRADGHGAPISALAAVPAELKDKPVLNDYGFGGYLIFSGVKPFIDGRADMFGDAMLGLYRKLAEGDAEAIEDTVKRYRIAWTIFSPDARIVTVLDHEPGWRRLYADRIAVVHVRDAVAGPSVELRGD